MHLDTLAANRSCTMRSRRNKNIASALREILQSRHDRFSVLRLTGRGTHTGGGCHVDGITFCNAVDFHQVIQLCCVVFTLIPLHLAQRGGRRVLSKLHYRSLFARL